MSEVFSGKLTTIPKYFCVIPLRLRKNLILILALRCDTPTPKQTLIEKANIEILRLNELLLLFIENRIIELAKTILPNVKDI